MAHNLEMINGKAQMFFKGQAPWHNLGREVTGNLSVNEAINAAGLNWSVALKDLQTVAGEAVTHKASYRTDTGAILGVVGPQYTLLQNQDAFNWFSPFVTSGEAAFETAGSLRDGRRVWALAKINRDPMKIVGDDVVEKYILLSNSHDGSMAVRVGFTPIRVVCENTLTMSINNSKSSLIRLSHTKNVVDNLEEIREVMNVANASFESTAEQYRGLAQKNINSSDLEKYVRIVFGCEDTTGERKSRVLEPITNLFENGRGNNLAGVRGTYWAAYNAITEYVQYDRGTGAIEDKRLNETWFGSGMVLNKKALSTALIMAGV